MPLLRLVSRGLRPAAPLIVPLVLMSMLPARPLALSRTSTYASRGALASTLPANVTAPRHASDLGRIEGETPLGGASGSETIEGFEGSESPAAEGGEGVGSIARGESASAEGEGEEAEVELEEGPDGGAGGHTAHAGAARVRLSRLRLTRATVAALSHHNVRAAQIRFSFTLSSPDKVRVRLARAHSRTGHVHWSAMADSVTLAAARGRDRGHLYATNVLVAGSYRLTLSARNGGSRALIIHIR
jgi:hypothetical protein